MPNFKRVATQVTVWRYARRERSSELQRAVEYAL